MPPLFISEVARRVGIRTSAIRYYEQIGLLPPAPRVSGQRRYDSSGIYRLAVIQRARQLGFTLDEIRELFLDFPENRPTRMAERWQALSRKKLAELAELSRHVRTMQNMLKRMIRLCRCESPEQCGRGIFQSGLPRVEPTPLPRSPRRSLR